MGADAIGVRDIRLICGDCPRWANQPIATVARLAGILTNLKDVAIVAAHRQRTHLSPQPSDPAAGTVPVGPAGTVPGRLETGARQGYCFKVHGTGSV